MDISKYVENKELYTFVKVGTTVVASKRKWDAETGEETIPDIQQINPTELKTQEETLRKSLDGLIAFQKDIDAVLNPME